MKIPELLGFAAVVKNTLDSDMLGIWPSLPLFRLSWSQLRDCGRSNDTTGCSESVMRYCTQILIDVPLAVERAAGPNDDCASWRKSKDFPDFSPSSRCSVCTVLQRPKWFRCLTWSMMPIVRKWSFVGISWLNTPDGTQVCTKHASELSRLLVHHGRFFNNRQKCL